MNPASTSEGYAVAQRREDLGTFQAVGEAVSRRPGRKPDGEQREPDRTGIGEHVGCVCQQSERVGQDARDDLADHEGGQQTESDPEPPLVGV